MHLERSSPTALLGGFQRDWAALQRDSGEFFGIPTGVSILENSIQSKNQELTPEMREQY
jgi:hypothetical protein